jgi:hypothetical protein
MAAARAWLEHQQRWLLVLDNAVEPAALVDLLPRSGLGQVVITPAPGSAGSSLLPPCRWRFSPRLTRPGFC